MKGKKKGLCECKAVSLAKENDRKATTIASHTTRLSCYTQVGKDMAEMRQPIVDLQTFFNSTSNVDYSTQTG